MLQFGSCLLAAMFCRLWSMLAHRQGGTLSAAELVRLLQAYMIGQAHAIAKN